MAALLSQSLAVGAAPRGDAADRPTFESIYSTHAPTVFRWVRRLAGPGADVDDLAQEVFLRVHRALPAFRGESQVRTWLYRIVARVVSRHRRRRRLAAPADLSTSRSPEEDVGEREGEALLYRALDRLDGQQRALLVAFELQELSGAELAEALGIKLATLWVRLHRARHALQRELERLDVG